MIVWCAGLVIFLAGLGAGFGADRLMPRARNLAAYPVREKGGDYKFIDPLLTYETPESNAGTVLAALKTALSRAIAQHIASRDADKISIYIRALNSGRWIAINPDEHYSPASLLKVPTMMTFFKLAESDPGILSRQVLFSGNFNDNNAEHFKPGRKIQAGQSYTINELVKAMIVYSDNNATRILHDNVKDSLFEKVYGDLGISISGSGPVDDFMTVGQFTYFFRTLYNATYLNRALSERALGLLSMSDFSEGIEAGVSSSTVVAHKFGERTILAPDKSVIARELHDCGIVYYPLHPYLLCVMTSGKDFDRLAAVIQDISRMVYEDRARQYRKQ